MASQPLGRLPGRRTTVAISAQEKLVLDYFVKKHGLGSLPAAIRRALELAEGGDGTNRRAWGELVKEAENQYRHCERHGKPVTLATGEVGGVLAEPACEECVAGLSPDERSKLMDWCFRHDLGYHQFCLLCRREELVRRAGVDAVRYSTKEVQTHHRLHVGRDPPPDDSWLWIPYDAVLDPGHPIPNHPNGVPLLAWLDRVKPSDTVLLLQESGDLEDRAGSVAAELSLRYGLSGRLMILGKKPEFSP